MKKIQLYFALPIFFVSVIVITGSIIIAANYFSSLKAFNKISNDYITQISTIVSKELNYYFAPISKIIETNSEIVNNFYKNEKNFYKKFYKISANQIKAFPQIVQIFFTDSKGNFRLISKNFNSTYKIETVKRGHGKIETIFTLLDKNCKQNSH